MSAPGQVIRRAVLDTNVIISALLSRNGNPAKIIKLFLDGSLVLAYSDAILDEYEDVLYRPRLKIPKADADIVVDAVSQHGERIFAVPSVISMPDEDDRVFFDTAKTADAFLITGNTKHYPSEAFVMTPAAFLGLK